MIRSAITASLVEEARGGPFVFWDGLADACEHASRLGFDAIEIFAPSADAVDQEELNGLLEKHSLKVAAVGTGAGMVKHGLKLTDDDEGRRRQAVEFIESIIDFGAPYGAPAIIGSMQGRWGGDLSRDAALARLGEASAVGPVETKRSAATASSPVSDRASDPRVLLFMSKTLSVSSVDSAKSEGEPPNSLRQIP